MQMQFAGVYGTVWRMRGPRALAAACAALVLVVAQLAALTHAASVRHIVCAQHGEQIDAPTRIGAGDDCAGSDVHAIDGGAGEHEDCVIARWLGSSIDRAHSAPIVAVATVATDHPVAARTAVVPAIDLVLIAPKTSPPPRS